MSPRLRRTAGIAGAAVILVLLGWRLWPRSETTSAAAAPPAAAPDGSVQLAPSQVQGLGIALAPVRRADSVPVTGLPAPTPLTRPGATPVVSNGSGPAPVTPLPPETRPANPAVPPSGPASAPAVPVATPAIAGTPVVVPSAPVVPAAVSAGGWRWPTQGQLIGRFSAGDPKRQGIDIAGTAGQSVVAAADGVVVYSGAGLVGYGELIIIKHSDEWLSAYAHSRKRLVTEGTAVRAGQPIAELGRSGTSRDMLHFEVRRNGKPVDPLSVLPPP